MEFLLLFYMLFYHLLKWLLFDTDREKLTEIPNVQDDYLLGRVVISFIVFVALIVLIMIPSHELVYKWSIFIMYGIVLGYQTFMEWKYLKNSKEYVCSLGFLLVGLGSLFAWI
ncbi:DUF4181 domain-containing protein [Chengkuizengella axinellae]|uniref:DUF4181 domain-containing protein n=1 Tax=Chengkuizengella axinellae TaxID=3064388 RepID=A0ABT9IY27_9BACL|nr:DUF4181 domain-containing protein [Chengkuizengella sp. 2205SS18-9]MDP5274269.1 DUF4181 domain-containing protein [Chengkuizengella sp. 2205SS18-9]